MHASAGLQEARRVAALGAKAAAQAAAAEALSDARRGLALARSAGPRTLTGSAGERGRGLPLPRESSVVSPFAGPALRESSAASQEAGVPRGMEGSPGLPPRKPSQGADRVLPPTAPPAGARRPSLFVVRMLARRGEEPAFRAVHGSAGRRPWARPYPEAGACPASKPRPPPQPSPARGLSCSADGHRGRCVRGLGGAATELQGHPGTRTRTGTSTCGAAVLRRRAAGPGQGVLLERARARKVQAVPARAELTTAMLVNTQAGLASI